MRQATVGFLIGLEASAVARLGWFHACRVRQLPRTCVAFRSLGCQFGCQGRRARALSRWACSVMSFINRAFSCLWTRRRGPAPTRGAADARSREDARRQVQWWTPPRVYRWRDREGSFPIDGDRQTGDNRFKDISRLNSESQL